MPSIKDIAVDTSLSIATISKHLNGQRIKFENAAIIDESVKRLNYKVNEAARTLKTNKTMTIGALGPALYDGFCAKVLQDIEQSFAKAGYSMIICDYLNQSDLMLDKLDLLMSKRVDGLIIFPIHNDEVLKRLREIDIPMVIIDQILGDDFDSVLIDNETASYNATRHLIECGHRDIGIICGTKTSYTSRLRLQGYIRALMEAGLPVKENYIKHGGYALEDGYDITMSLFGGEDVPTALYATTYYLTLGAVLAVQSMNIAIGQDISIVGFDNLEFTQVVRPSLTMVVQPMKDISDAAYDILHRRLNKETFDCVQKILPTEILYKDSVKRINIPGQ